MTDADTLTVIDAIRVGKYANVMPLPFTLQLPPVTDDMTVRQVRDINAQFVKAKRECQQAYNVESARLDALFRTDLEHEHGVVGHPKADKLFELAWDMGHAHGYEEVANYYGDLVELLERG